MPAADHGNLVLVDGHNDLPWRHRLLAEGDLARLPLDRLQRRLRTDIPRLRTGRVSAQFWSVFVPASMPATAWWTEALLQFDFIQRLTTTYPDDFTLAVCVSDVAASVSAGSVACLIGVEGGHVIADDLEKLETLFELGARYLTLTHESDHAWASSATGDAQGGLTPFGESVIRKMNHLGMIVDVSHCSDRTALTAIKASSLPVICSHSNARALCDSIRNCPDEVIAAIAASGGMVMATFAPELASQMVFDYRMEAEALCASHGGDPLDYREVFNAMMLVPRQRPRAHLSDVVKHVEHIRYIAGINAVGLGGDLDGTSDSTIGLTDVACYPKLFQALRQRKWSRSDIAKLAGRNSLRVLRDHERGTP